MDAKAVLTSMLAEADIRVGGDRPWDIRVHNEGLYKRVLREGTLGAGEAYLEGWWDCDQLDVMFCKALHAHLEDKVRRNLPNALIVASQLLFNLQSVARAPMVAEQHYNTDNAMFARMLGPTMNYSCGYWKDAETLDEAQLTALLTAYQSDIPLGMITGQDDFRISVAGAQEKTALLRMGEQWCIPQGATPTTHIIKLPIGEIKQPNATLDLRESVDNEYLCLALARELGLAVPEAEIITTPRIRALAVTRFDRRWAQEGRVLLRLPQEDLCQAFGLPSAMKYESDGGPGIAAIMTFLLGSSEALKDRYDFMKFMVFQWLTGATDGHAKNFSIQRGAGSGVSRNRELPHVQPKGGGLAADKHWRTGPSAGGR